MIHADNRIYDTHYQKLLALIFKLFSIFTVNFEYKKEDISTKRNGVNIMCVNCNNIVNLNMKDKQGKETITIYTNDVLCQNLGIYWLIRSTRKIIYDFNHDCKNWIKLKLWYNKKSVPICVGICF